MKNIAVIHDLHFIAIEVLKEVHCQPHIVVLIVRRSRTSSVFRRILFIFSSNKLKLMIKVSRDLTEKVSVQFLQIISKHKVNRLEAAIGSIYSILRRLSRRSRTALFDLIIICCPTTVSAASFGCKDLSDD